MPRTVNCTKLGISNKALIGIADEISFNKGDQNNKMSWGEPAKICQARIDRACPVCGARGGDEVQYSGNQLIAGFESDGKDGMCGGCGFTFTTGCGEVIPPAEDPKKSKPRRKQGKKAARKRAAKAVDSRQEKH